MLVKPARDTRQLSAEPVATPTVFVPTRAVQSLSARMLPEVGVTAGGRVLNVGVKKSVKTSVSPSTMVVYSYLVVPSPTGIVVEGGAATGPGLRTGL